MNDTRVPLSGLEINVVHACNLKCEYCTHLGKYLKGHVSLEDVLSWYGTWYRKLLPGRFTILGGERINVSKTTENIGGALAWLWNPNVLREIAFATDLFRDDLMRTDVHVPVWLDRHGYKMLHHLPSLIQHADDGCSTYTNTQTINHRQSDTFIDENVDMMEYAQLHFHLHGNTGFPNQEVHDDFDS